MDKSKALSDGVICGANVRVATIDDLPSISKIYNYYVIHSTATFATEEEAYEDRLQWFEKHLLSKHPILVMEDESGIIGWASLSAYHTRQAYSKTVESSIYLDFEKTGKGYGDKLFAAIINAARDQGYHAVLGIACSENTGSLKLMERHGFVKIGELKEVGRKFDRWLDVTIVEMIL